MVKCAIAISLMLFSAAALAQNSRPRRKIPCKTFAAADACYWTHGRLRFCCGTPTVRLWKIGTHRVLGVFSGQQAFSPTKGEILDGDNEHPELPKTIEDLLTRFRARSKDNGLPEIFGDFEVCPLEPERPKTMQAVCIQSAKNLVAK